MLFNLMLLGGMASISAGGTDQVQETLIEGSPDASEVIAVIDVSGPLIGGEAGVLGTVDSVATIVKHLRHAAKSPNVKAVVLDVDSPGGTVRAPG
jgi:ClpP class serine protease